MAEEQESALSNGTAEEQNGHSLVTVFIITVFLGVLTPGFVN